MIGQTYYMYRQGNSESSAYSKQTGPGATDKKKAWMRNVVHNIFSDSRSMSVNIDATTYSYEINCVKDPLKYIRDPSFL